MTVAPAIPTYARVPKDGDAGIPADGLWHRLEVWDLDAEGGPAEVKEVLEANITEGWLVRYARNPDGTWVQCVPEGGYLPERAVERVEGRFEFRLKQETDA